MSHQLINSKLEDWSRSYTGAKFHAVLCDPPYGISFMGKTWDQVSAKVWGEALLPHLYPGALCLMFGSTRMWHKLATGMEDAGFEIWDTLMWLYGQGFPKGQDISKLITAKQTIGNCHSSSVRKARMKDNYIPAEYDDWRKGGCFSTPPSYNANNTKTTLTEQAAPWSGHKTCALKPAWEPILAFRVPAKQTYAALALGYGSGCLNIDGARIGTTKDVPASVSTTDSDNCYGVFGKETGTEDGHNPNIGRYPANLLLDEESAAALDEQSGISVTKRIEKPSDCGGNTWGGTIQTNRGARGHSDSGGASRFFYCAKASTSERNTGCDTLPLQTSGGMAGTADQSLKPGSGNERNNKARNSHPTVKPLALTEYLAKLLLPPVLSGPRRLLVPFAGSGSEMIGALKAGWDEVIGIEQDTEQGYCQIAEARIAHHLELMSK